MLMLNKRVTGILITVVLILLVPLIAMLFTNEVKWGVFDFVIMGMLLLGTALTCELVLRKVKKLEHRIVLLAIILLAMFLIWAELAVGIFGTPLAGS